VKPLTLYDNDVVWSFSGNLFSKRYLEDAKRD